MLNTWHEEYIKAYNSLSAIWKGGASERATSMTAAIFASFKMLVDYVSQQKSEAILGQGNPFDLTGRSV